MVYLRDQPRRGSTRRPLRWLLISPASFAPARVAGYLFRASEEPPASCHPVRGSSGVPCFRLRSGFDSLSVFRLLRRVGVFPRSGWRGRDLLPVPCCPCGQGFFGSFSKPCASESPWRPTLRKGRDSHDPERPHSHRRLDPGAASSSAEGFVVMSQLPPQHKAALIFGHPGKGFLIAKFLAARLQCEIRLPVGDDRLRRIAVLDNEVAGVTGKCVVRDASLCS